MVKHLSFLSTVRLAACTLGVIAITAAARGDHVSTASAAVPPGSPSTQSGSGNLRATFTGVTLVDGNEMYENATIRARSRSNPHSAATVCRYIAGDRKTSLGRYTATGFGLADTTGLKQFCIDMFPARQKR